MTAKKRFLLSAWIEISEILNLIAEIDIQKQFRFI